MENNKSCCSKVHAYNCNSSCCGVKIHLCRIKHTGYRRSDLCELKPCSGKVSPYIRKQSSLHCKEGRRNVLGLICLAILLAILKVKDSILFNFLMKNRFRLNAGISKKELILLLNMVLILLCDEDIFVLNAKEDITKLHSDTLGAALNKSCKLLRFLVGVILQRLIQLKDLRYAEIGRHSASLSFSGKTALRPIILSRSKDKQAACQLHYSCYTFHKYTTLLKNFFGFGRTFDKYLTVAKQHTNGYNILFVILSQKSIYFNKYIQNNL